LSDHRTGGDIERGKLGRGAMASAAASSPWCSLTVAGEHQHPGVAQHLDRWHGQPVGTVGDERDAGLGHRLCGLGRFPLGDAAVFDGH